MKLLLDQNLSYRLINPLRAAYPGSRHVSELNLGDATDAEIWRYAQRSGYAIVTQDADFHDYSVLHAGPPLIIWLTCGNQSRADILERLLTHREAIEAAAADPQTWCIELT